MLLGFIHLLHDGLQYLAGFSQDLVVDYIGLLVHLHEVRWGGGESVVDVYERVGDFFDSLADSPAGPVVIVSHGFTIQIALTYLHGGSPYDVDWATLPNGGIVTVEPSGVQVT